MTNEGLAAAGAAMAHSLLWVTASASLGLAGPAAAQPAEGSSGLLERGGTLYSSLCQRCHGDSGDATDYPGIVPLAGIDRRLGEQEIAELSAPFVGRVFEGGEARALAAYLGTLGGGRRASRSPDSSSRRTSSTGSGTTSTATGSSTSARGWRTTRATSSTPSTGRTSSWSGLPRPLAGAWRRSSPSWASRRTRSSWSTTRRVGRARLRCGGAWCGPATRGRPFWTADGKPGERLAIAFPAHDPGSRRRRSPSLRPETRTRRPRRRTSWPESARAAVGRPTPPSSACGARARAGNAWRRRRPAPAPGPSTDQSRR